MREVVFDVEANALLDDVSKLWVIAGIDLQTKKKHVFTDQVCKAVVPDGSLEDGVKFLVEYDRIICHNICGYDHHVLEKFYPKLWNRKTVPLKKCWDTLVQSRTQHFKRPRLKGTKSHHGLEYYGLLFNYPKPPIEDWTVWDEEKLNRVLVDIEINARTYRYLNKEAQKVGLDFETQIRRTQATSYWYALQELHGTMGDVPHMKACVKELDDKMEDLRVIIEPLLPKQLKVKSTKCTWSELRDKWDKFYRKVPKDKEDDNGKTIKPAYFPTLRVYLKSGLYDKHTANHFNIPQEPSESRGKGGNLIGGAYTKIEYNDAHMGQHAVIKDYLLSLGWIPTEYNLKKGPDGKPLRDDRNKVIRASPKLTEDSYDTIEGELGKQIATYNTYASRRRTIENQTDDEKGWINKMRPDGRISSGCMAWATETGRGVQTGIVNIPSNQAVYGAPMRRTWVASEGNILVSVDQDSAQIRLLANYMGDPIYTQAVLAGEEFDENHQYMGTDPHTLNACAFGVMNEDLVIEARETQNEQIIKDLTYIRKYSKNGFYCYL